MRSFGRKVSACPIRGLAIIVTAALLSTATVAKCDLPTGWTDQDIGSPSRPGSASYSAGTWTVNGGGADIWDPSDQFNLVSENYAGNGAIVVQVLQVQPTDVWAKAGVMFRNDYTPGSAYVDVVVTPGNGVNLQWRSSANGSCGYSQIGGVTAPVWLKLVRVNAAFSGYYGTDGTTWIQIGNAQAVTMNDTVLAGLTVTAHNDNQLNTATFNNLVVDNSGVPQPPVPPPVAGWGVFREMWTDLASASLYYLTNQNPNWPNNPNSTYTKVFTNFETEINSGMVNYGQRVRTFVVPPKDGPYTFWISSDDSSTLFLSSDESPSNVAQIANVNGWTDSRKWNVEPNQQSAPVVLQAHRRYYLEAIMTQGGGGDNLAVRWQLPDGTIEEPLIAQAASGTLLIPCNGVDSAPGIYGQSTNVTVIEGQTAALSVLVTNSAPVSYQWCNSSGPINNSAAQKSVYCISNVPGSFGTQTFTCILSNASGVVASSPVQLTIIPDTTPPVVTRVQNVGTTNVQVLFSKQVSAGTASVLTNYAFADSTTISSVSLSLDGTSVTLTTSPMVYGNRYTLVLNNIQDMASVPNTIETNTTITFVASPYASQDIGYPSFPSSFDMVTNGFNVAASGTDIGGNSDQFNFEYQMRTGNFDEQVRLAGLSPSDVWAKAGMMARETLNPNSRFAAVLTTPSMSGSFFEARSTVNTAAATIGQFPVNYPYTWLRLKRVGNTFSGYASYDGQTWMQLGSMTIALPSQIYFGFAVCSHNNTRETLAQFCDFGDVPSSAVIGTIASPHEPLGPCDRKTCLVISEIMYKPAPRTDGNNVEFLEIYNSNPYFQDVSGYKLMGTTLNYTFPAGTVMPGGGFVVVAASPQGMQNVYGLANAYGPYTGSLKKADTINLIDDQGAILLTIPYSNVAPWPVATDGTGFSLVMANPTYGAADPRAWSLSDEQGGSPGTADPFHPTPLRSVMINELMTGQNSTFIELYNHSTQSVDLAGCILTDVASSNKFVIPSGITIAATGFVSFNASQLGFSVSQKGGTVFFFAPNASRVLDAVSFEAQADGVSTGRSPNGAPTFYPLNAPTPGAANSDILIGQVVINELMYDPISGNDDDQYIELYNRGTTTVSLAGWQFTSGVTFTFPTNASIVPDRYLVIARNVTNILAEYSYLTADVTLGNFTGKLAHKGKRVALAQPQVLIEGNTTNTIYVVEDEVTYGAGGRWGQWSKGGGSSLELINPNSNHRLAYNWADSDESGKSVWTNLEVTGILDNGANYNGGNIDYVQVGLLDVGGCLVDNIEVHPSGGANIVINGDFEAGMGSWSPQGDHQRSSIETASGLGGFLSKQSLHLRSSDSFWTLADYVQGPLSNTSMTSGQTATLRLKARWLQGSPYVLMRLRGNWLEVTGALPLPTNLGTPGLPNSRYATYPGAAIYDVKHSPALPAANQPLVVSARFHDKSVCQPRLCYRIDTGVNANPTYTYLPMVDNGANGDAIGGDGVYSATIPGQTAGTVVAFLVQATDVNGAVTIFPSDLKNNAGIPRECVVGFGDTIPTGSLGHHHLFLTQNWAQRWAQWGGVSHELYDGTWIDGGGRIIYNWNGRYAGSPYHQYTGSPISTVGGMHWQMPEDDQVFGTTSFNKQHVPGNGPLDDDTLQREQTAFWMARQLGVPWQNRRYYLFFVNGVRHAPIMEDAQVPGSEMIAEYWPNDTDGWLYKNHGWFEGDVFQDGNGYMNFNMPSWSTVGEYTTTINGKSNQKKLERYRWMWLARQYPDSPSNYTNVYALADVLTTPTTSPTYYANVEAHVDTEEWLRLSAAEHATGDWDSFFTQNQWNMYNYKPAMGKWTALKWDWNITLGSGTATWPNDGSQLLTFPGDALGTFHTYPPYLRAYLRALKELSDLAMNTDKVSPLLDAKYSMFQANGISAADPGALKGWIGTMHDSIRTLLTNQGVSSVTFAIDNSVATNGNVLTFTGSAPLDVKTIQINGVEYPVTWTSVRTWSITVPLGAATNHLVFQGRDVHGNALTNLTLAVDANYSGTVPSPAGNVVINEIMYNPLVPGAAYVELYNAASFGFDLSGWNMHGLSYTFPAGSYIAPKSFLVLAANRDAFINAYGTTMALFDTYPGNLQLDGETLTLTQPGSNTNEIVVAKVRYESSLPWPTNVIGMSLQLIDATKDNWRVGNWAVCTTTGLTSTPNIPNRGITASLPAFPPLWINEVQPSNLTGITNKAGQHAPWIEIYNPTTNSVSLVGLYLANSYTNLGDWSFPAGAVINPGEFKVIFADGQTNLSTLNELHTDFVLTPGAGSVALSRAYNSVKQVLDYVNYTNLPSDYSYGSLPDGQSFTRLQFPYATPAASNASASNAPSYVAYASAGTIYTQNFDSLPNPGNASVNTDNPVTINGTVYSLANPYDFAAPTVSSGSTGGLGLSPMAGWYGSSALLTRFGATSGDQTTGGQLSFGGVNSNNRALGLLATSTTGATAFGVKLINLTGLTLDHINLSFTGEVWRQSNLPKTMTFSYVIDPTSAQPFNVGTQNAVPSLNVSFPTVAADSGGVPVDGTAAANQVNMAVTDQPITSWAPGATLWLIWEMDDSTGKSQGLAIDNLSFSATAGSTAITSPTMTVQSAANGQLIIAWPTITGPTYQLEYKTNLNDAVWTPCGAPITGNGNSITVTNALNEYSQCFLRLKITR